MINGNNEVSGDDVNRSIGGDDVNRLIGGDDINRSIGDTNDLASLGISPIRPLTIVSPDVSEGQSVNLNSTPY